MSVDVKKRIEQVKQRKSSQTTVKPKNNVDVGERVNTVQRRKAAREQETRDFAASAVAALKPNTYRESMRRGAEAVAMPAILINAARERAEEQEAEEFASHYRKQNRAAENSKVGRDTFDSGVRAKYRARTEDAAALTKEHDRLSAEMSNLPFGAEDAPRKMNEQQRDIERRLRLANNAQNRAADYEEKKAFGQKYAEIPSRADFAENSQNRLDADGGRESRLSILPGNPELGMAAGAYYTNTGWGDDLKRAYINNVGNAREVALQNDIYTGRVDIGEDYAPYSYMDEREVGIYNYLYNTEGKDAAEEYLSKIEPELNARRRSDQMQLMEKLAREHHIAASALSLMTSPMRGATYIMQGLDYLEDGKIDQNAGYNKWSYGNTAIRNEVSRIAEENWGKVGSFLYQTGMSMGDFLLTSGISGGSEGLSLAIMGSGAAADTVIEAKDRGLSDDQAFALGTVAGAAEVLTEKVSLETLLDKTSLSKGALGYWLKNVLAEGSEEVGSDLINTLADLLIAQDKSELRMAIDAYVKQGHTESEAVGLALRDKAADMGVSFLGGALSGGVMAGVPAAVSGIRSNTDPRIEFASDAPASTGVVIAENKTTTPAAVEMPRSAAASMTESRMDTKNPNAQRVYNSREVETFVQNSDAFGENGKKAFTTMYDGGDFAAFYADFAANYNAGVRGTSRGNVTNRYSGTLTDAQALAAYSAGKNDADAVASTRQTSSGLKIYSRSEAGLVAESAALIADEGERSTVDKLAKSLGVRVQIENIAPRADGSKVNGYIKDGDIHISADADSVATVIVHELSHRIQEAAPKEYAKYRRLAMEQLAREHGSDVNIVEQRKTEYQRGGIELSNEAAMDEIVADYAQRMMDDPAKFAEVANDNPNLARRLLNTLHNLIVRVKSALGNEAARLERIEAEWRRALSAAQHTVAKAQQTVETANTSTTADAPSVAAAYSIKTAGDGSKYVEIDTDQHLFDNAPKKSYAAIARRVLLDRFAGQTLPLGENDLARLEANQTGEYAYPRKQYEIHSAEYAAKMRAATELDNLLETAEYSHWAKDTKNHKEATLGFDYYKTKFVVDGHSFEGLVNIANSESGRIFYDITKIEEIPDTRGKPATGMAQSASSFGNLDTNSISESGEDVNAKFSLSADERDAQIHSEAFKRWFGDWQNDSAHASKVVDENGAPLVVYHATWSEPFTVFDRSLLGDITDGNATDPEFAATAHVGFWFNSQNLAGRAGERAEAVYLNIRNPYVASSLEGLASDIVGYAGVDNDGEYDAAASGEAFADWLEMNGYDGIVLADEEFGGTSFVVLHPEQIKSATGNIGTFDGKNPDIRFSLSEGESLTDAAGEGIITDDERGAILQYKSSESFKINAKLRDGLELSEQEKRFVENLDSGLRKLPKVEGTLYRTLNFDDATDAEVALNAFLAEHKTGFPVRYLAYTSTSITPDGHPLADDVKFGVVMEIEGKTARSLEGFGNNFENEALYPRNARFDVLSVERVADGIYHIKAREVVNDAGESKGRMGLHPEERDGTVREVSETHRTHNDLRGVSGVDTGRGDGQEGRLPGLRAEGVDEKFSLSQNKRANEVEYLRELNDYLREQMKMTSRPRMTQNAMNEVVRDVTSRWGSAAKKVGITEKLWRLYGEMASGKDSDGGALAWETVRDEATEIAGEILRGAVQQSNPMYEEYGELRRTLRNTKIAISETDKADLADVGGYTEFRKQNEHRLALSKNGVPVDQIYDELHERYGELFPAGITHPADQLIHIADVLDSLQPVYENVYSEQEMAEANDYIAAELIDGFYSVPTEGMETERVRAEKNARIEQVKKDGREAMRRAVQAERESKERAVENLKKQYEKREQRRADSATRQKLLKLMQRCERMKTTPQNKAKIAELIGELDTVSVGITGKTLAELEGIKDHVERMRELDPDYMPNPKTLEAIDRISKKRVADMSMEDVTDLIKALRNIETETRNERRMVDSAEKLDIYIAGEQLIEDVRAAKGTSKVKAASALIAETLSPERYVKRITGYREGNALVTAMKELSDGQRKSLDYRRRSEALLEKFTSDKKFMASITGKNAKTVKISAFKGGELTNVEITRDMLISLYLASKNEQNLYHMAEGGVRVPDMALYRKGKIGDAYDRGTVVKIAPGVAKSAVLKLTEQERAYAEVIHYYFNSVSKAAINEVSMKLRGYEAAEVEEYYPIQSDSAYTRSSPETVISKDASIANPGWLEKRETRASNPLRLIDATKVTSDAIAQHGMYYGIAIPANNMVKLLNVTVSEMDENTGERIKYSDSVKNALKNVWGAEAEDYLNGILSDVQKRGGGSDGALGAMLGKLRSGYAGAVLTLNASVALKQAASYTTAAAEMGWKPLAKAMKDFGSVDLDLIAKYTPLQWYRSLGYSSTELGDMAKNKKQLPKALNWIQMMDVATTRKLWKASEYYVRDGNKALKVGTEEYYREVADVYNRVIENTQPNYTAMQRSKVLRSDNQLVRSLMMFKTQPFQNFNILYDAAGEYAAKTRQYKANPNAETKAAAKTARGRLAAAITSQLVSAVIFASMTAVWNMFRGKTGAYEDEEKDEMTVESFLAKLGKDTLSSLMGSVPFGSDVYNFAASKLFDETYYGMEVSSVSAISDLAESVGNLWSVVESAADASTGADNWSNVWVEFDRSADNITKVFGVPYENVVNLINASARWAMKGIFGKYLGDYYALRMTTNTKRSTEYYDCLWRAYKNDRSAYEKIYADMAKSGFSEDAIRSNMEKRMKDEQGVEKVDELDSRYLSPEQSKDYDALAREVAASRLWRSATSGQKESAEEMMYDLATNNGDGKKLAEKVDGGAAYGLSESDYILYRLALEMVDEPSESGKYGTYTTDEVQAAIDMVDGLSDAARAYLWEAAGKNAKTNPYR